MGYGSTDTSLFAPPPEEDNPSNGMHILNTNLAKFPSLRILLMPTCWIQRKSKSASVIMRFSWSLLFAARSRSQRRLPLPSLHLWDSSMSVNSYFWKLKFSAGVFVKLDRFEYVLVSLSKVMVPISEVNITHWFFF